MVGPHKQFDKAEVLEKAMAVFWEKGYEATSMQDLVDSMGINRASMYQTYGNKYNLYLASIECYITTTNVLITQVLSPAGPTLEKLTRLLKLMIEHSFDNNHKGCLINNSAVELAPHDASISKILTNFWSDMNREFASHLQYAIDNNEINSSSDPHQIAFTLNAMLQGLMVISKTNCTKKQLFDCVDHFFSLITK